MMVRKADAVVLPGVGAFKDCMRELTNLELIDAVAGSIKKGKPYLGICLGLQVLFSESEEFGKCRGLDVLRGKVVKFDFQPPFPNPQSLKIPHMGWNEIKIQKNNPLFKGITDKSYFYFVHSYYVVPEDNIHHRNHNRLRHRIHFFNMERQYLRCSISPGKKSGCGIASAQEFRGNCKKRSLIVFRRTGCILSGAISARGLRTKSLSLMCGCGISNSGVLIVKSS